jgi:hypothetical protein
MLKHLFTGLAFFVSLNALALTQDDITFPDAEKVQNHPLVLNGIGFRKATFLKIKVYAAGLYLEKKSQNSDEIIKSTGSKKVVLKFLRNVSVEDVRGAWEKSFKSLCETEKCDSIQADIQKFKDSIEIEIRGVKKAQIPAGLLTQLVLKTWIGPNPPNSELKEGLLGL